MRTKNSINYCYYVWTWLMKHIRNLHFYFKVWMLLIKYKIVGVIDLINWFDSVKFVSR
jgi:hypothetical protein